MTDTAPDLAPEEPYDRTFVEREDLKRSFSMEVDAYREVVSHATVDGAQHATITFRVLEDVDARRTTRQRKAYLVCNDEDAANLRSRIRKGEPTAVLYFPLSYAEELRVHLEEREERPVEVHVREYKGGAVWAAVER